MAAPGRPGWLCSGYEGHTYEHQLPVIQQLHASHRYVLTLHTSLSTVIRKCGTNLWNVCAKVFRMKNMHNYTGAKFLIKQRRGRSLSSESSRYCTTMSCMESPPSWAGYRFFPSALLCKLSLLHIKSFFMNYCVKNPHGNLYLVWNSFSVVTL